MRSKLHQSALDIAKRLGLSIHPCQPRSKAAVLEQWQKRATTDEAQIDAWWNSVPDFNVGIATGAISGIFVLDVDDGGEATLRALEAKHGPLPPTIEVITGKGRHVYFRLGEYSVSNSVKAIGAGLDIRGTGGYVLAAGSIHPSGREYAWSVDSADEFADAPEWLHDLISANGNGQNPDGTTKARGIEHWHRVLTNDIPDGARRATLVSLAGKLYHHDVPPLVILELLDCVNESRCKPPAPPDHIEEIVLSVGRTHAKGRGQ